MRPWARSWRTTPRHSPSDRSAPTPNTLSVPWPSCATRGVVLPSRMSIRCPAPYRCPRTAAGPRATSCSARPHPAWRSSATGRSACSGWARTCPTASGGASSASSSPRASSGWTPTASGPCVPPRPATPCCPGPDRYRCAAHPPGRRGPPPPVAGPAHRQRPPTDGFGTLRATETSDAVLSGTRPVPLRRAPARPARAAATGRRAGASAAAADLDDTQTETFERLRGWRAATAKEQGVPAYVVVHDAALRELVLRLPTTLPDLATVSGIGAAKVDRYGARVLEALTACPGAERWPDLRRSGLRRDLVVGRGLVVGRRDEAPLDVGNHGPGVTPQQEREHRPEGDEHPVRGEQHDAGRQHRERQHPERHERTTEQVVPGNARGVPQPEGEE